MEGFSQLVSVFMKASKTLYFFSITRQQKNSKTIGAYTESTDSIFKTFKQ